MQLEQPIANYNGNPQKENGYTPIANELLEALMLYPFSKRQLQVLICIMRMTYGYSRKSDALSGWQISKFTNLDRSHVSKTLDELINLNVVIKHEKGRVSHGVLVNEISINKIYDTWLTVAKTAPLPIHVITVAKTATQPLPKQPTHKAIKTNKTNSKKTQIPKDFFISERVKSWATKNKYSELEKHLENFILVCESKDYKYTNWDSAFMRAIKDNWAKVKAYNNEEKEKFNSRFV